MSPAVQAGLRHVAADLVQFDPYQLDDRAAEYAALPGHTADHLRHITDEEIEYRHAARHTTGGTR